MKPSNAIQPSHYTRFKIQPLDFIETNGIGFAIGNVIKYVCRYDAKNGLEDLLKAREYLDRKIAQITPAPKPRKRKPRVKVVEKIVYRDRSVTVPRQPTLAEVEDAFPALTKLEIEKTITALAFEEIESGVVDRRFSSRD